MDQPKPEGQAPELWRALREGYSGARFRADAAAGLTVAIVALPLSMAIAIASGLGPERGLTTAIIGGALVSALGGSRFQVGGPAGAFIVLVSACGLAIGLQGLILATLLSGLMLIVLGLARMGSYIRFIPYPVTLGFTAGIGVIIFASQLKELFGIRLSGAEPGPVLEKLRVLWAAREGVSWAALGVALGTIALIEALKRFAPKLPSLLLGVVAATVICALSGLPVETISARFGDLPRMLPAPALPEFSWHQLAAALPWALSFTLLGAIESLLSAMVADGMSGTAHRSNVELVGQGLANIGSALFGGFCVTGTIARTATNVRAGSTGPVSGLLHAVFLALFMLIAAPLAGYVPLSALAGVLAIVAWNMIERDEARALIRASKGDALVLGVTFLLVVFRDLTEGIVVGFALGGLVFIRHMAERAGLQPLGVEPHPEGNALEDIVRYRLHGAVFFGAVARLGAILDHIAERPRVVIVDFAQVSFLDSTGAHMIAALGDKLARRGGVLRLEGASAEVAQVLRAQGLEAG